MKIRLSALITFAIIAIAANAWAFNRNLTGSWHTPGGDDWAIGHVGSRATFSTTSYNTTTGMITFEFNGSVSGVSGEEDKFKFVGLGTPRQVRINGKMCRITSIMAAGGYVSGQLGGRIIEMEECEVDFKAVCKDVKEPIEATLYCNGTWT